MAFQHACDWCGAHTHDDRKAALDCTDSNQEPTMALMSQQYQLSIMVSEYLSQLLN